MLPQSLPQEVQSRFDENPTFSQGVEEKGAGNTTPFLGLLPSI